MKLDKNPFLLFLFLLLLCGFIEIISYDRFTTSSVPNILFVALLLLLVTFEPKKSIYLLIPSIVFADDISRFLSQTSLDLHSIWTIKVFGFTFPYLLILSLIYPIFIYYIKEEGDNKITKTDKIIFLLFLTYGTAMLSGIFNISNYFKVYLSDIAPFAAITTIYIFIRTFLRDEESTHTLTTLLIYSIGVKALLGLIFFFSGYGASFGTTIRVTNESGRIFYTLGIFLPAGILLLQRGKTIIESILLLLFMFSSLFITISYAGRMSWILTIVGAVIFLSMMPRKTKRTAILCIVFATFLILAIMSFTGRAHTLALRFATLTEWSPYSQGGETSTAVRIVEIINVWHTLLAKKRILWGIGAGGYFTDKYFPFPFLLTLSDYRLEWIQARTFFHTHIPIFNIFFKGGLIALFFYLTFAFKMLFFSIISYKQIKSTWWKGVLVGFASFYPLLLTHNWSTKQNILIGIILGILVNLEFVARDRDSSINVSLKTS